MADSTTAETEEQAAAKLRDRRTRAALGAAPSIAEHVREIALNPIHLERGVSVTEEYTPLQTQKVDDLDELYAQLINWVLFFAEELQSAPPTTTLVAWSNSREVQGFKAGTTPAGAKLLVRLQTMWLLGRNDRITAHQSGAIYQDDVAAFIFRVGNRYPRAPRPEKPLSPRPCPTCGEYAVTATWNGENLVDVDVTCQHCAWTLPENQYDHYARIIEWIN